MNLEDIARLAGVSRSTVSRAINNQPRVKQEVRERVLEIIKAHNYQPNSAARALVQHRTNLIAVAVPEDFSSVRVDAWFQNMVADLHRAAKSRDLAMMFLMENLEDTDEIERVFAQVVLSRRIDGIALLGGIHDHLVDRLRAVGFPFVVIGWMQGDAVPAVDVDNRAGGRAVAAHLWEQGARTFGLVRASARTEAAERRCGGFYEELAAHGVSADDIRVARTDYSRVDAARAIRELLTQPGRPDAVFAQSDWMAHVLFDVLDDVHLRVPDDIAVASFDEFEPMLNAHLGLTTVVQPTRALAEAALDTLVDGLPGPVLVPTRMIIRASSGAATPSSIPVGGHLAT